jgi:CDGSH-type Zn-finger protein
MTIQIKVKANGPFIVDGDFVLVDEQGNEIEQLKRALCRCGGSTTKPFCDGTHSKIGFQGANEAVRKSEGGEGG